MTVATFFFFLENINIAIGHLIQTKGRLSPLPLSFDIQTGSCALDMFNAEETTMLQILVGLMVEEFYRKFKTEFQFCDLIQL